MAQIWLSLVRIGQDSAEIGSMLFDAGLHLVDMGAVGAHTSDAIKRTAVLRGGLLRMMNDLPACWTLGWMWGLFL